MMHLVRMIAQGVVVTPEQTGVPDVALGDSNITSALKLVFGVAGGIALLIVTIAGFKYVLSQGNPQETAKAKNTILYALIGLVVCIFSFAIVEFVIMNIR